MRYQFIISCSKVDESFVEVPELPGCMADGATYKEATSHAQAIVQEWISTARSLAEPISYHKGNLAYP